MMAAYFGPGGNTWDAEPTDFTTIGTVQQAEIMESIANTDGTVTWGGSTTQDTLGLWLEFNAS